MPNALPRKIAPLWAILKPLALVAVASNAPLVTNGHASNPSRNFAMNTDLLSPAPAPDILEGSEKLATGNIIIVLVPTVTLGTQLIKYVNTTTRPTASSEHCITVTVLALINLKTLRHCWG